MKRLNMTEATAALTDPWPWALGEIQRRNLTSRMLGERLNIPRSSLRQLYNGRVTEPSYKILQPILTYLVNTRGARVEKVEP